MYAIIKAGGKQYKVETGSVIKTELTAGETGSVVEFPVIMYNNDKEVIVGEKAAKVKVVGQIVEHGKDKKIIVFKYKAKKNVRKKQGHRQPYSTIKIVSIN